MKDTVGSYSTSRPSGDRPRKEECQKQEWDGETAFKSRCAQKIAHDRSCEFAAHKGDYKGESEAVPLSGGLSILDQVGQLGHSQKQCGMLNAIGRAKRCAEYLPCGTSLECARGQEGCIHVR
jgi:hypothetical protein